jgi:hypothetical protein
MRFCDALSSCDEIFVQTCLDQNFTQKGKGLFSCGYDHMRFKLHTKPRLFYLYNNCGFLQDDDGNEGDDYKENQRFAEHMKDKTEGSSDFATQKTLKEQRQFLPIFSVRQEVKYEASFYAF